MDVGLVCDACSALTPIGVPQCARCGQPVALAPRQKRASVQPPQVGANGTASPPAVTQPLGSACAKCGSNIPPNFKFCPSCGNKVSTTASRGQQDFDVQTRVGPRSVLCALLSGRSSLFFGGVLLSVCAL